MQINFSTKFIKMLNKAPENIKKAFHKKRCFFILDYNNPILNNHKLSGKLKNHRSINISGDWRAIYCTNDSHKSVIFCLIGTHSELYR